jgi:hypothetical protein
MEPHLLTPADRLAILAFEAALDRDRWLWAQLCRLEQKSRRDFGLPAFFARAVETET